MLKTQRTHMSVLTSTQLAGRKHQTATAKATTQHMRQSSSLSNPRRSGNTPAGVGLGLGQHLQKILRKLFEKVPKNTPPTGI